MIYITKQKKNVNYSDNNEEESSGGPFAVGGGILGGLLGVRQGLSWGEDEPISFVYGKDNEWMNKVTLASLLGLGGAGLGALGGRLIDKRVDKKWKEKVRDLEKVAKQNKNFSLSNDEVKAFIDSGKIDNEALLEAYKETNKDLTGEIAKGVFDTPILGHISRYENWLSNIGSRDQGLGKMPKRVLKQIASAPLALPLGAAWPLTAAHRFLYHENALTTKNIEDSIPGLEDESVKDVEPKLGKLIDSYNSKLSKKENKKYLNWVKKNVADKYKDIVSGKNGEYKPSVTDDELKQYLPGFTEEAIRFVR